MNLATEQQEVFNHLQRILNIFIDSDCQLRPHFWLVGPSGSGKSHSIQTLALENNVYFIEINAAQLTREGVSGNSISKALGGLKNAAGRPTVVFVDEFDKLFISGNSNSELAHDSTTSVQNEFLKVIESDSTQIFSDYGKYVSVSTERCLFVFAGAFNGEPNLNLDSLRDFGVKTEFLGRVPLLFQIEKPSKESLFSLVETSPSLITYVNLFDFDQNQVEEAKLAVKGEIEKHYDSNTLGVRMINTLIHQYFIYSGKFVSDLQKDNSAVFTKKLSFK